MIEKIMDILTMNKYVSAAAIFIIFYALSESAVFITEKIILRMTRKTKTTLDDEIVKNLHKPVSMLLLGIGAKIAWESLEASGKFATIITNIVHSFTAVIIIYIITSTLNILIKHFGEKISKKTESTLDDHIVSFISKTNIIIFIIAAILTILKVWGVEIAPLLAGLGIGGIAIAFAMQKSLSNIFGGISLILDRSINVGDIIVLEDGTRGKIMDIGLRSTKILTFDNEAIIIPNGRLEEAKIQNIAKPDPSVRVVIEFGVAYGTDVEKAKKIVVEEIKKIEGRKKDSEITVRFSEMGNSALIFKAYFWMENHSERFRAKDEANTLIYNALRKNRIEIPFPQMDVHIRK